MKADDKRTVALFSRQFFERTNHCRTLHPESWSSGIVSSEVTLRTKPHGKSLGISKTLL